MSFLFSRWLHKCRLFSQLNMKGESELCEVLWFKFWAFLLKLSKIWKLWLMVQKFPGKVSGNSGNCWISETRTIQPNCWISETRTIQPKILEIPGAKLKEKKLLGKSYWKFGCNSRGCPLFENFGKYSSTGSCRKFKPDDSALYLRLKLILPQLPALLAPAMAFFFLFGGAKDFWFYWKGAEEIFWTLGVSLIPMRCFL